MKKLLLFCLLIIIAAGVYPQVPPGFNYQAVLRDASGQIISSEDVEVQISILKDNTGGEVVFSESHNTQTNEFGIINLQIGSVSSMESVEWGSAIFFIQVSVDNQILGVSQLLSVPFAMHSATSADSFSGDYNHLANTPDLSSFIAIQQPQNGDILVFDGSSWQTMAAGEEGQVLMITAGIPQWKDISGNNGDDPDTDTVTDIDGNIYPVIEIGDQKWMGTNLRTSKYADGSDIPGNLTNAEWTSDQNGAYAVQDHTNVNGVDSEEQMIAIYGKMYNWYAVDNSSGLCPAGWRVPDNQDWDELNVYLNNNGYPGNEGNALKSCRQVETPLGGECNTTEHPRWNEHATHFGTDNFGFSALPGGFRRDDGPYLGVGGNSYWWTSEEVSEPIADYRAIRNYSGVISPGDFDKRCGFYVRCIKE